MSLFFVNDRCKVGGFIYTTVLPQSLLPPFQGDDHVIHHVHTRSPFSSHVWLSISSVLRPPPSARPPSACLGPDGAARRLRGQEALPGLGVVGPVEVGGRWNPPKEWVMGHGRHMCYATKKTMFHCIAGYGHDGT